LGVAEDPNAGFGHNGCVKAGRPKVTVIDERAIISRGGGKAVDIHDSREY
jgi:hypothetical protein